MTVIAALYDPDENVTWLGSNGRATIGSYVGPALDRKWRSFHGWAIGITGTGPKLEALEANEQNFPKRAERPFEVLTFMKEAYGAFDIGEMEEGLKRYCGNGLLVHKSGAVWDFDNSFCLSPVAKGAFWTRGSGMDLALGAGFALKDHIHSPKALMKRVLEIVVANDVDSPGEILIQTFDHRGVLSDPLDVEV
ncbi:hypothetical protein [Hyphococcus luteus]|uniref:Uncharacterized protein n=1 Tax=Hyphococcus luteus TaxID=2058213 RepID=A0A2S7K0I2_9PROT|nr:hypothetical protein [Marinicaulis flavus]PQA85938.1 hypothetical protein CW354_16245 [Marinicaulis flavus]